MELYFHVYVGLAILFAYSAVVSTATTSASSETTLPTTTLTTNASSTRGNTTSIVSTNSTITSSTESKPSSEHTTDGYTNPSTGGCTEATTESFTESTTEEDDDSETGRNVLDKDDCSCSAKRLMPLAVILSFLAGVLFVLIPLGILKLRERRKWCFREKHEPVKDKWEGASVKVTDKVLRQHTLERLNEIDITASDSTKLGETYESYKQADAQSHKVGEKQDGEDKTYEQLEHGNRDGNDSVPENVYSEIQNNGQKTETKDVKVEIRGDEGNEIEKNHSEVNKDTGVKIGDDSQSHEYFVLAVKGEMVKSEGVDTENGVSGSKDQVYEYVRDSAVSSTGQHEMGELFTFENENFRNSVHETEQRV